MDTLILQVDCKANDRDGPPQLGITVEAPYSVALQQRQQQQAKDYRNHDYQNCHLPTNNQSHNSNNITHDNNHNQNGVASTAASNRQRIIGTLGEQTQRGLQITNIQKASVIDRNGQFKIGDIIVEVNGVNLQRRTFQEAQKTLREFVVKQSSHGPLFLKVLRKAASSSSLPSTTGSQSTVIEQCVKSGSRRGSNNNNSLLNVSSPSNTTSTRKSSSNSVSTPSPQSSSSARHFVGALNTRRIGTIHRMRLTKSAVGGFGIKIAERDNMFGANRPIYITAITTTGSAYEDGRLREGDMLLEVNGVDLSGKSQPEVTQMLKGISTNESVEFVVSRQEDVCHNDDRYNVQGYKDKTVSKRNAGNNCDNNKSLIDLDVPDQDDIVFTETTTQQFERKIDNLLNVPNIDGPGNYVYEIPLNDTKSAGLGLYLKYPTLDRKDLGIWIENVITGGAAWKDGKLQQNDQILAINGIDLSNMSNAEASETLRAAISRGIGPEALPNTIRLNIHRRDPSVVAKILQGTNNRIEHSDLPSNGHNRTYVSDKNVNNTQDSFRTALDATIHSRSQSSNDTSGSNKSSNQNSHNDSAMSPQTQASNSLKMSNSCNDRSDNTNSDKTNDTSSAISQITDFTTLPINDNPPTPEHNSNDSDSNQAAFTLPKTLEITEGTNQNIDPASSVQSWDDESVDVATGEERFQRDGFGRQSISEKRHAQLMAKSTDTYKRNQKLREERERQRQIEDQLERQRLDDSNKRFSLNLANSQHQKRIPQTRTINDINSMYGRHVQVLPNDDPGDEASNSGHREVPVDVHLPADSNIGGEHEISKIRDYNQNRLQCGENLSRAVNQPMPAVSFPHQMMNNQFVVMNRCWKCGSVGQCTCRAISLGRPHLYASGSGYDDQIIKRPNSLESIQPVEPIREGLVISRAGTVRVARNRKINESFRAAVDRSYEGSTNDSVKFDYSSNEQRRSTTSTKVANSVANSTTFTSDDERFLINNNGNENNPTGQKKNSSLLTRFLKFGSMKKSKKKNKDSQKNSKLVDASKSSKQDAASQSSETTRSQTSKSSHSRTQSTQSHPNSSPYNNKQNQQQPVIGFTQMKTDGSSGQFYNHSHNIVKQAMSPHQVQADMEARHMYSDNRNSIHYHPIHNLLSQNHQMHHHPIAHPKLPPPNLMTRPNNLLNSQQYSHIPVHHQTLAPTTNHARLHQLPQVDIHGHPIQFHRSAHLAQNAHIGLHNNGCNASNQWQSQPLHTSNGLWVANSPVSESQIHPNNIYEAHAQHAAPPRMHNRQTPVTIAHPTPFIPSINGQAPNGIMHHPPPILQGQAPTMTQQHLHNQQPQHIYYYDF